MPIGTLIQKIHCQARPSTTAPPTNGPSAIPRPMTPDHTPSAMPRFSGGTASDTRVSVSGRRMAAPTPWMARPAISSS